MILRYERAEYGRRVATSFACSFVDAGGLVVGGKGNNELSRCKRGMRGRGADDKNNRRERLLTAKKGETA